MGSKVAAKSQKTSKVEKVSKKEKAEDVEVETPKVDSSDSEAEETAESAASDEESSVSEAEESSNEDNTELASNKRSVGESDDSSEESESKKSKVEEGPCTIFVGGLSWGVDNDWLRDEMKECGEITDVRVITDRASGKSKGFAYVEFATHKGAKNAMELSGKEIDGRAIRVDFSENKQAAKKPERTYESPKNEPSDTLFIGNLSFNSDEESIRSTFSECGELLSIRLPTDRDTGRPKGFGYIQFSSIDEAKAAMEFNGTDLDGRSIRLDFAAARKDDGGDRRGGFGGDRRGGYGGGRGGGRGRGGRGRGGPRGGRGGNRGGNRGGFGQYRGSRTTFD